MTEEVVWETVINCMDAMTADTASAYDTVVRALTLRAERAEAELAIVLDELLMIKEQLSVR